ncbi:MAG: hypothetical protein EOO15_11135 [Chitinophagaceae bacterium]|nr:MAG: hypothetical protein EOO15_11135 [Chitinophagaceae bacterium]
MKKIQLLLALGFLLIAGAASAQVMLALNLQPGKTYAYSIDLDIHSSKGDQSVTMEIKSSYDIFVSSVRADTLLLRCTYSRMAMAMDLGETKFAGDSRSPLDTTEFTADAMMNRMVHALTGKSFTLKITREGAVVDVLGVPEMTEAVVADAGLPEGARENFRTAFTQQFNERSLAESFTQSFHIYPNKVVKVGDSWNRTFTNSSSGLSADAIYTVKAIKGDLVYLDIKSDLKMSNSSMQGTQKGDMVLEAATGLMRNGSIRQHITGDAEIDNTITIIGNIK